MKICHRDFAQAIESRDILLDLLPVGGMPDVVRDLTNSIKTNKKMDSFELFPEWNEFFWKNRPVRVISQADMARITRFAACLHELELLFDQERFAACENDVFQIP